MATTAAEAEEEANEIATLAARESVNETIEVGDTFQISGTGNNWGNNSWQCTGDTKGIVELQDTDGLSVTIKGVAAGTVTFTLTYTYSLWFGGNTKTAEYEVTVTVNPKDAMVTYNINRSYGAPSGVQAPDPSSAKSGDVISLPAIENDSFIGWSETASANENGSENYLSGRIPVYRAG